jgi:hypothetical protein
MKCNTSDLGKLVGNLRKTVFFSFGFGGNVWEGAYQGERKTGQGRRRMGERVLKA